MKIATMDLYDGTTGSKEHLSIYKAQMYVQDVDDAAHCHCFPAIVKGEAQSWFNDLTLGSVSCF